MLPRRRDGGPLKVTLLGQPSGFALQDHVLALNLGVPPSVATVDRPTMIFMGGWDSPETTNTSTGTGCLAFMYPVENAATLAAEIGSVDLSPPEPK